MEAGLLGWSSNSFLAVTEFHLGIGMYAVWAHLENDDNNGYPKLVGPKVNDLYTSGKNENESQQMANAYKMECFNLGAKWPGGIRKKTQQKLTHKGHA